MKIRRFTRTDECVDRHNEAIVTYRNFAKASKNENLFRNKYLSSSQRILAQAPRRSKKGICSVICSCVGNKNNLSGW